MVNVAVLGYGTIGSGVVEVLQTNTEIIAQRAGEEIAVKYILDLRDFPGDPNADKVVHDYDIIDKDEDVGEGGRERQSRFQMRPRVWVRVKYDREQ